MWDTSSVPTNNCARIPCFRVFACLPLPSSLVFVFLPLPCLAVSSSLPLSSLVTTTTKVSSSSSSAANPTTTYLLLLLLLPSTLPPCILSLIPTNAPSGSLNKPTPIANTAPKRFLVRYVFFDSSHSISIHHPINSSLSLSAVPIRVRAGVLSPNHSHLQEGEGKGSYHVLSLCVSWLHSLRDSLFEIRVLCRWSLCKLFVSCTFVLQVTMPKAPKQQKWMMRRNERT